MNTQESGNAELFRVARAGNDSEGQPLFGWADYERALENGADINARDTMVGGRTALLWAIHHGYYEIADRLLEVPGIDLNEEDDNGMSALHLVSIYASGHLAFVQKLVSLGANPHQRMRNGNTVLGCNCGSGHFDVVEYLLDHCGCDPMISSHDGWTALHSASRRKNNHRVIVKLLDNDADIHARLTVNDDRNGNTSLHMAAQDADRQVVRLLLDRGSRAEDKNRMGRTALHLAAARVLFEFEVALEEEDHPVEVVKELILRRADTLVRDNENKSPLDLALSEGNTEICDLLLEAYKNHLMAQHGPLALHAVLRSVEYLDFTNVENFHVPLHPLRVRMPAASTALTFECFWNWLRTFDLEMIGSPDNNGDLPIHVACALGAKAEVLRILVGLDPATLHHENNTGKLPIHVASGSGRANVENLRFLVNEGGIGTLSARDRDGALPLHCLLGAHTSRPELDAVEFLLTSFRGSASVATNEGHLPFVVASKASCSLDVLFFLLKAYPEALALSTRRRNSRGNENDSIQSSKAAKMRLQRWLQREAIGCEAIESEMALYAQKFIELGLHSKQAIIKWCTKKDVQGFDWMKMYHKRALLGNLELTDG